MLLPRASVGEQGFTNRLPSITISTSVKFSFRNMSGADSPRWRQNPSHSEPRLPHIITDLEDKQEVSLFHPLNPFL